MLLPIHPSRPEPSVATEWRGLTSALTECGLFGRIVPESGAQQWLSLPYSAFFLRRPLKFSSISYAGKRASRPLLSTGVDTANSYQ